MRKTQIEEGCQHFRAEERRQGRIRQWDQCWRFAGILFCENLNPLKMWKETVFRVPREKGNFPGIQDREKSVDLSGGYTLRCAV